MLEGRHGKATMKAMQILTALGKIFNAERMIPVSSVQVAGVSFDNLGDAGLAFLNELADGDGKVRVLTTLNPAGMDIDNWQQLGISEEFAKNQIHVIEAFTRMGIIPTCTCTPYLSANLPQFGEHIAWAESSAVCYANSVIGARTNREGGPGALSAALTGVTPEYGLHLSTNRVPTLSVDVEAEVSSTYAYGALGRVIGEILENRQPKPIPYIIGITQPSLEELKSFCASIATYGGAALFHMPGITPEASQYQPPDEHVRVSQLAVDKAAEQMDEPGEEVDFVTLGCPHLSLNEIKQIAEQLAGKTVKKEFWITTSRPVKLIADRMGYTQMIEKSGAKIAADTCCVVAPIRGRFHCMATDSAKACYYAYAKNKFKTRFLPFDEVIQEALR